MIYIFDHLSEISHHLVSKIYSFMPKNRQEKFQRYRKFEDQKNCALVYALLLFGLQQQYPDLDCSHLKFCYAAHGKPFLENQPSIHFNMSHTSLAVACAISSVPIGIDIEGLIPYSLDFCKYVCSKDELLHLEQLASAQERSIALTTLWTRKEAYLKYKGTGITQDLKDINSYALPYANDFTCFSHTGQSYCFSVCQKEISPAYQMLSAEDISFYIESLQFIL